MKGYIKDGKDCAPCEKCKFKNRLTVEAPCYSCIDNSDLALHKPNYETEFANYSNVIDAIPIEVKERIEKEINSYLEKEPTYYPGEEVDWLI